jgi:hypothetical protein
VARDPEEDAGQPEVQRAARQQVQWLRLRRRLALRAGTGPPHQAEQVLHPGHPQVSMTTMP